MKVKPWSAGQGAGAQKTLENRVFWAPFRETEKPRARETKKFYPGNAGRGAVQVRRRAGVPARRRA